MTTVQVCILQIWHRTCSGLRSETVSVIPILKLNAFGGDLKLLASQ